MSIQVKGTDKLVEALSQMSQARFDAVCQVSASIYTIVARLTEAHR